MGNLNLKLNLAPFFRIISNSSTNFQANVQVVGAGGSWYAEKVVFNQDTVINRLGFTLGVVNGNPIFRVGFTTSIGSGVDYPCTFDGIPGSASTLSFTDSFSLTTNTASDALREIALSSDHVFKKMSLIG